MSDVTIVSTTADVTVISTEREVTFVHVGVQGPAGPSAHGELSGLDDDDHPQYHNNARGDARYAPLDHTSDIDNPHEVTAAQVGADASGTAEASVSAHAGGTGVHAVSGVTGLQAALDGKSPTSHDHSSGNGAQVAYASLSGTPTLGTAAALDVGTTANKVVQLDGAAKLPAIDGSQLTHLPAVGGITIHGDLSALESDDHPQYHNDTRGDLRYSVLAHNHTGTYETAGSVATHAALTTVHGISAFGATLVDDAAAPDARTTLGLGGSATLNVGTAAGTVAAGDDSRIVAATPAETTTTIGALINGATAKATPVDADSLGLSDSASGGILRKLTWGAFKTAMQSIFATLAGFAGGQTLRGGTAASETLTLQSTAHATKGKITALPLTIDEANLRVGLGQTTPAAALHIKAGTATASTAPLKLTSGPLLTVPEAGAIEYLSGEYYATNGAATPLRRKIATEEYLKSRGTSLLTNGLGAMLDNTNFSGYTYDQIETRAGAGSFRINAASAVLTNNEYIEVDTGLRYILSLVARSGEAAGANYNAANLQYFGVILYDIDKLSIEVYHCSKVSTATDTYLAVALNPGDSTITLTDATGWYSNAGIAAYRNFCWYGYANSFGAVYPDHTYTRNISGVYSSNTSLGAWASGGISGNVITLRVPWAGPAISAGVAVRNYIIGNTYKYITLNAGAVPNSWTTYSGYIGPGTPANSADITNLFRAGTAYLRFVHLVNYHGAADNNVRISALSLSVNNSANVESQIGVGSTYKTSLQSALPASGMAVEGDVGVGTLSPAARVHIIKTGEQERVGYDLSNYISTSVGSTGLVTETLAGTAAAIKWLYSDATTNTSYALATFAKNSTGAGAAGLGLSITLAAKSSTTVDMPQVTLASAWVVATHATRTARGTLNAVDYNGTREAIRWEADGTVARLGFFGATAVVKPTAMTTQLTTITYTDPGTPDYAVSDVTQTTPFGFTTADEARTVLSIIKNLQDRVGQLETKLQALGLLT